MKRFQKIIYFPGLISIILLPILCVLYLKYDYDSKKQGAIILYTWDVDFLYEETIEISNSRKFKKVIFTGNIDSDRLKLSKAQKDIERLVSTYDTVNGIQFHFENNTQYKTYIKLLEILKDENATYYIPYKNNIWFTNPTIPKDAFKPEDSIIYYNIDEIKQVDEYDLIKTFIKEHFYLVLIYIVLFYFGIRSALKLFTK